MESILTYFKLLFQAFYMVTYVLQNSISVFIYVSKFSKHFVNFPFDPSTRIHTLEKRNVKYFLFQNSSCLHFSEILYIHSQIVKSITFTDDFYKLNDIAKFTNTNNNYSLFQLRTTFNNNSRKAKNELGT